MVGDRWSLVIMRDLINGKSKFGDLLNSPERITTSVLADRLERLTSVGLIDAKPYQESPVRLAYGLTEKGEAMLPVLQEICRWANRFVPDTWPAPETFMDRRMPAASRS